MAHSYDENKPLIMSIIKELNPKSILDVGIGAGDYGELIRKALPSVLLTGIDVWDEYSNPKWDNYNHTKIVDMREFDGYDAELTIFIDSLEHLEKQDALEVLKRVKGKVLVSIPINYKQPEILDKYDKHLSEWTLDDFKDYKDYSNERSIILWFQS